MLFNQFHLPHHDIERLLNFRGVKMHWTNFYVSTFALSIQQYVDHYRRIDLHKTLKELQFDYGLPRVHSYDFIVVGAGTGGSLVASKLADKYSVLLLEEGGRPPPHMSAPYNYNWALNSPSINTLFESQAYGRSPRPGGIDKVKFDATGKMLGGSGSSNYNIYVRGSPYDWNSYGTRTGDVSWKYANALQRFIQLEDYRGFLLDKHDWEKWYGHGGPLQVNTEHSLYLQPWLAVGKEIGYPSNDSNARQIPSFSPVPTSTRNGLKESTYTAFVLNRRHLNTNLKVMPYSTAEEILFKNGTAYGVAYMRHGIPQIAFAKKEVIISAGVVGSPILLTKSGLGPKNVLKEAGIKPAIPAENLPLKFPLVCQLGVDLHYVPGNTSAALKTFPATGNMLQQLNKFFTANRTGVFIRSVGATAFLVSNITKHTGTPAWPDIQYIVSLNPILEERGVVFSTLLTRPISRGQVAFNTNAYRHGEREWGKLAIVDPYVFTHTKDKGKILESIHVLRNIVENTTAFRPMEMKYSGEVPKRCQSLPFRSDEYWVCHIEEVSYTRNPTGTCKMGNLGKDKTAVVDPKLRVRGVRNLRVVDASILPYPPNSGVNPGVMAVAATAAKEILEHYRKDPHVD